MCASQVLPLCAAPDVMEVVAISNDTTLNVGETALLACAGYGSPTTEINWSFNGVTVMNSSLVTVYFGEIVNGGRLFNVSFLQLCNLGNSDAGTYTCTIGDDYGITRSTTQLTVVGK